MTDIATTLRECHAIVWRYRAELEHVWPTPTTEDALLFAFTELGEAVDAHLRSKPEYARNRDKELSVLDELADCAMMLLTALTMPSFAPNVIVTSLAQMAHLAGFIVAANERRGSCLEQIDMLLFAIATYPGMDLPARLTARLERIKAKRLLKPKVTINDAYAVAMARHESEAA